MSKSIEKIQGKIDEIITQKAQLIKEQGEAQSKLEEYQKTCSSEFFAKESKTIDNLKTKIQIYKNCTQKLFSDLPEGYIGNDCKERLEKWKEELNNELGKIQKQFDNLKYEYIDIIKETEKEVKLR